MSESTSVLHSIRQSAGRLKRNFVRRNECRWGQDFTGEFAKRVNPRPKVIFDVGGFIGLNALKYADSFPSAIVHTFEPTAQNLSRMDEVLAGKPSVLRHKTAVGAAEGTTKIFWDPDHPSMSRMALAGTENYEEVPITTIDSFAASNGITHIDIMKIDTEGHELAVLEGAKETLSNSVADVVILECGLRPNDALHVNYSVISEVMFSHDYHLFGFYEQYEDTLDPGPDLRRADVAFIAPNIWKRQ